MGKLMKKFISRVLDWWRNHCRSDIAYYVGVGEARSWRAMGQKTGKS